MLSIRNVTKSFHEKDILKNISINVKRGEIATLLGGSGVGKSTLLRILNGLEAYDTGTILLDEKLLSMTDKHHAPSVGMVFQQFNLFEHLTVERNITLPVELVKHASTQEAVDIATQLLEQYQLLDKRYEYPSNLSGGQKQRLAIARSLALKPTIICFDEPTSALDPLLTNHVAHTIKELTTHQYIVLIATHDTELIRSLPCTMYLMKAGHIIEHATSSDLAQYPDRFDQLRAFITGTQTNI